MSDSTVRQIWKYRIPGPGMEVDMPQGATPLCVQLQRGKPTLWAEVDPAAKKVKRKFNIVGTGQLYPYDAVGSYVGTWLLDGLVWHLFDGGES